MKRLSVLAVLAAAIIVGVATAATPPNVRLSNDGTGSGYVSDYTLPTGVARTASAGDPTIAWDNHGRVFCGSETSDDPAGTKKTFGDIFVARFQNPAGPDAPDTTRDGVAYKGTTVIAKGSSAPNLLGKFNDKDALEVDRTGGACDGYVYMAWSRFTGNFGTNNIYFSRSTDHGVTFSSPMNLTPN